MGTATMSRSLFGGTGGVAGGLGAAAQGAEGLLEEEEVVFQDAGDDALSRRLEDLGVELTDDGDGLLLYRLTDASVICGGRVGGGADHRICLKADGECVAAAHQASRDEELLAELVDKVLVRTKPGGGAKAAYTSPAISFAVFWDLSDPSPTLGGYGASIDREVAIFGNADKRQAQSGGSGIRWL